MKHCFSSMMIALTLALVLVVGVVALAESENTQPQLPAANDLMPPEAPPQDDAQATQDDTALQEALKAYNEARSSSREQSLQEELDGYVADGKLTQAQADLIMDHYREQNALRNGTCPNCGYQFRNGNGKGGHMNGGGRGGKGGKGGRMNSGFDRQFMSGQADGMSAQPDMQARPDTGTGNGI